MWPCIGVYVARVCACVCVCVCVRGGRVFMETVRPCVSLCQRPRKRADLGELCSTFAPLLIHPVLPLCLPGWDGMEGGRDRV